MWVGSSQSTKTRALSDKRQNKKHRSTETAAFAVEHSTESRISRMRLAALKITLKLFSCHDTAYKDWKN